LAAPFLSLCGIFRIIPVEFYPESLLEFWLSIGIGLLAFDLDLQIFNELVHRLRVDGIEEVRLIKDKRTGSESRSRCTAFTEIYLGQSRQFAFAQFVSIPKARAFLDEYSPTISLDGAYDPSKAMPSDSTKVRIAYSRDKDDRDRPGKGEDDWNCEVVSLYSHFRCTTVDQGAVPPVQLFPSSFMFSMQRTKNS
jgi:hypothetical protein